MDNLSLHSPAASEVPVVDVAEEAVAPGTVPSEVFQQEAFNYVSKWCKSARDFVNRKVERWKLLEDLYHNRRELNSWSNRSDSAGMGSRTSLRKHPSSGKDRWQADIILSPSYIVDAWADKAYQAIFNGPEWLSAPFPKYGSTFFC
jgi:hypothetical protein